MPRLSPRVVRTAYKIDRALVPLLRECRTLQSAQNELRWLGEHARTQTANFRKDIKRPPVKAPGWRTLLQQYIRQRSRGKPIQYIVGNQPFGELEIICKPGVLIPRPETETYVTQLCQAIIDQLPYEWTTGDHKRHRIGSSNPIRILDMCTGTGCIALLVHSLLAKPLAEHGIGIQIVGVDIDPKALKLANWNLRYNTKTTVLPPEARTEISFVKADVLAHIGCKRSVPQQIKAQYGVKDTWDIIISNPPYISERSYQDGTVAQSVKKYEPKLALVPPPKVKPLNRVKAEFSVDPADAFYEALIWHSKFFRSRVALFETGDKEQARRVVAIGQRLFGSGGKGSYNETWKDGSTRAVVFWRD